MIKVTYRNAMEISETALVDAIYTPCRPLSVCEKVYMVIKLWFLSTKHPEGRQIHGRKRPFKSTFNISYFTTLTEHSPSYRNPITLLSKIELVQQKKKCSSVYPLL